MISEEEVKHIAKLARLELSGKEVGKMQKDLSAILDYFNLLQKIPKTKTDYSGVLKNIGIENSNEVRKDEAISQKRETVEKIIAVAPDKKDGYIKVKNIF